MKDKLSEYIHTIFADAERRSPGNRRLAELKEEMIQNLYEKYDDLIADGKSPAAAYNIAVSSIGDITNLLDSVCGSSAGATAGATPSETTGRPTSSTATPPPLTREEQEQLQKYRNRSAILASIAIALYILCVVPCILIQGDVVGPVLMFVMIAIATAMLIFNGISKPKYVRDIDDNDDDDDRSDRKRRSEDDRPHRSPVYKAISGALWTLTVCVYLLVSFLTGFWHITWMMFLITTAVDNIIKAIFDLRR